MELGAEVYRARFRRDVERHVDVVGYATAQICLEENRSVIAVMDRVAGYVSRLIRLFEAII
jgi:hypothetical protein